MVLQLPRAFPKPWDELFRISLCWAGDVAEVALLSFPPPSSSKQGCPVWWLAWCCCTLLKGKIVRFPFSFVPTKGGLKGALSVFDKIRKQMQKEKVWATRRSALKLGSICCMDDCATCSLAQTCQIFVFPVSYIG